MVAQPPDRALDFGAAILQESGVTLRIVVVTEHEVLPEAEATAITFLVERLRGNDALSPDAEDVDVALLGEIRKPRRALRLPDGRGAFQRHPIPAAQEDRLAVNIETETFLAGRGIGRHPLD